MCIRTNNMGSATCGHCKCYPVVNKLSYIHCLYGCRMYVKPSPSFFITTPPDTERSDNPLAVSVTSSCRLMWCTSAKCNRFFASCTATIFSDPYLQRHFTLQVPNLMVIFHSSSRFKRSPQVRGPAKHLVTSLHCSSRALYYIKTWLTPTNAQFYNLCILSIS
jgi:hypothetical protein